MFLIVYKKRLLQIRRVSTIVHRENHSFLLFFIFFLGEIISPFLGKTEFRLDKIFQSRSFKLRRIVRARSAMHAMSPARGRFVRELERYPHRLDNGRNGRSSYKGMKGEDLSPFADVLASR